MKWHNPTGRGLGLKPMKTLGGRWMASLTDDVTAVMNHVEMAQSRGLPIKAVSPQGRHL